MGLSLMNKSYEGELLNPMNKCPSLLPQVAEHCYAAC